MPAVGHVEPMLVVGQELLARGWQVRMLTGAAYADRVTRAGATFHALPPEADTLESIGSSRRRRGLDTINTGVEEAFIRPALPAARAVEELRERFATDVVLHDMTFLGVQGLLTRPRKERPLVVMCGIGPAGFSSRDTAPYGLGIPPAASPTWGRVRNRALRTSAQLILRPAHRALDDFLRIVQAPALGGRFFMDVLDRSDILAQFTTPEFEYPRPDAPAHLRFYGPMQAPIAFTPPDGEWAEALDTDLPIVHVTQGTVANTDFTELIAPTLTALSHMKVRVIVTTGGADPRSLPALPDNARAVTFVPYHELLPRTSVFVTNGGYGGLHQALVHGVPIVVAGDSEDKIETSARVQWSGAGISLRTGRPTYAQLYRAIARVLVEPAYRDRARLIGQTIRSSGGAPALVTDIETALHPARDAA